MIIIIGRWFVLLYLLGVVSLICKLISREINSKDNMLNVLIFPFLLMTKKGRKQLNKLLGD